ncbi:MAG: hypothetical protein WA966_10885 [Ornithinimicrobium sp.]
MPGRDSPCATSAAVSARAVEHDLEDGVGHGAGGQRPDDGQLELFDASPLVRGRTPTPTLTEGPTPTFDDETVPGAGSSLGRRTDMGRRLNATPHSTARPTTRAWPAAPSVKDRGATVRQIEPAPVAHAISADEVTTLFEMVGHERDVVSRLWRCVEDLRTVQDSKDALAAIQPVELSRALDRRRLRLMALPVRPVDSDVPASFDPPRATSNPEGEGR